MYTKRRCISRVHTGLRYTRGVYADSKVYTGRICISRVYTHSRYTGRVYGDGGYKVW